MDHAELVTFSKDLVFFSNTFHGNPKYRTGSIRGDIAVESVNSSIARLFPEYRETPEGE